MKQEIECFNTGAYWAIGKIRGGDFWTEEGVREFEKDLLPEPLWLTLFFRLGRTGLDAADGLRGSSTWWTTCRRRRISA